MQEMNEYLWVFH